MTIAEIYAGVEQADMAALTTGGVTYRCFVWRSAANRIEAEIFTELEDGQFVLVSAPRSEIVAYPVGDAVDCPRVLATGTIFVLHWVDASDVPVGIAHLYRALFDVTSLADWSNQGFVSIHLSSLYDHATVVGAANQEFVVARRTATGTIETSRYEAPFTWVDATWSTTTAGLTIADNVLGCHADDSDDLVLVSYQSASTLQTFSLDGGGVVLAASVETFPDVLDGDNQFTAVTHVRIAEDRYIVAAELAPDDDQAAGGVRDYARLVAWRQIRGSTAAREYGSHWLWNVHLLSRLWTWASGTPGFLEAYVAVSHKSIADGGEYAEQQGYVVRLDVASLPIAAEDELAGSIRPIPVSAMMDGSVDARPHGMAPLSFANVSIGVRMNHLSHVTPPAAYTLGPDRKAMTFAICQWTRLAISDDDEEELQPTGAAVGWCRFVHDEAWMLARDPKEPAQPDLPQWRGSAQRGMARPVETPAGLMFTGGVTTIFDGNRLVENGFLWGTEILSASASAMGGTMDEAATYYYYANWFWQDARGNIHIGPPSRPRAVAIAVNGFATLTIRCLNLGLKDDEWRSETAPRICVQVWRTTAPGGTPELDDGNFVFRSVFGGSVVGWRLQDLPANDPHSFSITVVDGQPNSIVQFNQIARHQLALDALQWVPPPPMPHQALHTATMWRNRVVGVSPDGPLVYSEEITKEGTKYVAPQFLDTNQVEIDHVGEVVAVVAQDYTASLLCRDAIYSLSGQPASGGVGGDLDVQQLVRGIGCVEPRSIVLTHLGAFFLSAKGLHLLDRSGGVQYPGAPVEDLLRRAGTLRGGVHLDGRHEVVWGFNEEPGTGPLEVRPRLLRYNYSTNRWAVDVLPGFAQAATSSRLNEIQHLAAWRARMGGEQLVVVLQQGGLALERGEFDTVYSDVGAAGTVAIGLDLQSEWLMLADVAGVYRIKEIGIQTVRLHPGAMAVDVYYDEDGTFDETAPSETFPIPSPAPAYISLLPGTQRVSALMVRIREVSPPATENVRIVKMMIRWAPKETPRRVPASAAAS